MYKMLVYNKSLIVLFENFRKTCLVAMKDLKIHDALMIMTLTQKLLNYTFLLIGLDFNPRYTAR